VRMCFNRLRNEGGGTAFLPFHSHVISKLESKHADNDIPSRYARISEVSGRFAGFLCQHLFVNSQIIGLNPSTSAETGLGGLSPLVTQRMTVGSGLLGKGTFPVYS